VGTTVVTGALGGRVVVTTGGGVVVGDDPLDAGLVVVVEGRFTAPPPCGVAPAPVRVDEVPVVCFLFALDAGSLVVVVLEDVALEFDDVASLEETDDSVAARALAAFAACATNIPVASPELRKIA
jgi:hypothetical protein